MSAIFGNIRVNRTRYMLRSWSSSAWFKKSRWAPIG